MFRSSKDAWFHFAQSKPPQIESTMIRMNAITIPKTISFIFELCTHIFLWSFVPVDLNSLACWHTWFCRWITKKHDQAHAHTRKQRMKARPAGGDSQSYPPIVLSFLHDPEPTFINANVIQSCSKRQWSWSELADYKKSDARNRAPGVSLLTNQWKSDSISNSNN